MKKLLTLILRAFVLTGGLLAHAGMFDSPDELWGGDADDWMYSDDGDDRLYGRDGDDWMEGGSGNDRLLGGSGNDRLYGGDGDDWMEGGPHADVFSFGLPHKGGRDVITDYNGGVDVIDIQAFEIDPDQSEEQGLTITVLDADADSEKDDTRITLPGDNIIDLLNYDGKVSFDF